MKGDYALYDATCIMTNMMSLWTGLTALQTQLMMMPFQPFIQHPLNPLRALNDNPVKAEVTGVRKLAHSALKELAHEMPDRVGIVSGVDQAHPPKSNPDTIMLEYNPLEPWRNLRALSEMFALAARNGAEPEFGIKEATIDGKKYPVTIEKIMETPLGKLLHFSTGRKGAPVLYIVAPTSGHGTTLIEDPIQSGLNAGYDVYTNGIPNARETPISAANPDPGLEDYIDFNRDVLQCLGPNANVWAICQATVPVAAAAATLTMEGNPNRPASLTFMAGPINPHAAKTDVTEYARRLAFTKDLISEVPPGYKGAGREVYAANIRQIPGFMMMHFGQHAAAFANMHNHIVRGTEDSDDFKKSMDFYKKKYLTGVDLFGRFYEETYTKIFVNNDLAEGRLTWRDKRIDLSAIDCPILTFEGSEDDISAPGQTMYAHRLMPKAHERGLGYHYTLHEAKHLSTFVGSNTRKNGIPVIVTFIDRAMKERGLDFGPPRGADGNRLKNIPRLQKFTQDALDRTLAKQAIKWANHCQDKEKAPEGRIGVSVTQPVLEAA